MQKKSQQFTADSFCRGYCAEFAIALHYETGWPIVAFNEVLWDESMEEEYTGLVHATVRAPNGKYANARGMRTEAEIARSLLNSMAKPLDKYVTENITPEDLEAETTIYPEVVEEAERFIAKNKRLWGLDKKSKQTWYRKSRR